MHRLLPALVLCVAACASASGDMVGSAPTTVIPTGNSGMHVSLGAAGATSAHAVGAPIQDAWAALPRVYEDLGIPLTTIDTRARRIGNQQFAVSRRLAGTALAHYLECGLGPGSVPHANTARITLSVLTTLQVAGDSTEVRSEVSGFGRLVDSPGNEQVRCTTTGFLEARIAGMLRERVTR
jgi:hypothetical protein